MNKLLFLILLIPTLYSCTQSGGNAASQNTGPDLEQSLPGTWETISLKVAVNSFENSDSSFTYQVEEEDWEKTLQVKPIQTYFDLENKYRRIHYPKQQPKLYQTVIAHAELANQNHLNYERAGTHRWAARACDRICQSKWRRDVQKSPKLLGLRST